MLVKEDKTIEEQKRHGIFLGTVVQHLTHGKLKVYIHGIYPTDFQENPEKLPTCIQIVPQFGGSFNGNGVFSYPNIGATVVCVFANGDQNFPIMLGAIQGGENAFGQYEIVKSLDEEVSDKHLVTSGKSHIELYEDGKISAIVADPIRTDAKVKYGSQVNDELSVDAVSQRPIADLVDVEALSNANCQLVLDTSSNHGTLSASTHFYDPSGIVYGELAKSVGQLSAISGEVRNDFSFLAGNNGLVDVVQSAHAKLPFSPSSAQPIAGKANANVEVHQHCGIDGQAYTSITSSLNTISNGNSTQSKCISKVSQSAPASFSLEGSSKVVFQDSSQRKTTEVINALSASNNADIALQTTRSEKTTTKQSNIRVDGKSGMRLDSSNGFSLSSSHTASGSGEQHKNLVQIEANDVDDTHLKLHCHEKSNANDIECVQLMHSAQKSFQLKIVDNKKKSLCEIVMGADGVIDINASTAINIMAPTITMKASTLNITGGSGDCKIKNVSLLNHVHQETQSGDVVRPQPTKSATASN